MAPKGGGKGGQHREPKTWGGSRPPKWPRGGGKHEKPSGGKHEDKGGGEGRGPKGDE
jgi:hypothetical protein